MCQFFETIRVENGLPLNLDYHQKRVLKTYIDFKSDMPEGSHIPDLKALLGNISHEYQRGTYKCKVQYNVNEVELNFNKTVITFDKYEPKAVKLLKVVVDDSIEYSYKQTNRSSLNALFQLKQKCDDILIIKHGLVTDTSYTNIVFYDGRVWVTPDSPLLAGTTRSRLLDKGLINEATIKIEDIKGFQGFKLINSMLDANFDSYEDIRGIIF